MYKRFSALDDVSGQNTNGQTAGHSDRNIPLKFVKGGIKMTGG